MTQFLYFFAGATNATVARSRVASSFAAVALRDLLRSDKAWSNGVVCNRCLIDGPGGQLGTVLAAQPPGGFGDGFTPAFVRGAQTWVKIEETAWLGWFTDQPPTEVSLRRAMMVTGYGVTLNDDCVWTAPVVRCQPVHSRVTLPQAIRLGDDGQRVIGVKEFYRPWQDLVNRLWDYRWGKCELSLGDLIDGAAELLSLNYRVGPRELDALGLFEIVEPGSEHSANWSDIITASYDWPLVEEFIAAEVAKKKSVPEVSTPSAGCEAETPPVEV